MAYSLIRIISLAKCGLKLGWKVCSAILSKISVLCRKFLKIIFKFCDLLRPVWDLDLKKKKIQ